MEKIRCKNRDHGPNLGIWLTELISASVANQLSFEKKKELWGSEFWTLDSSNSRQFSSNGIKSPQRLYLTLFLAILVWFYFPLLQIQNSHRLICVHTKPENRRPPRIRNTAKYEKSSSKFEVSGERNEFTSARRELPSTSVIKTKSKIVRTLFKHVIHSTFCHSRTSKYGMNDTVWGASRSNELVWFKKGKRVRESPSPIEKRNGRTMDENTGETERKAWNTNRGELDEVERVKNKTGPGYTCSCT